MRTRLVCLLCLYCLLLLCATTLPSESAQVPTPESVLGFAPGANGRLASYEEILTYNQRLAAASDRVTYEVVGKTTEGRDFVSVVISAPENLERIDAIRADNARLADPRTISASEARAIVAKGKVIVLLNESIHSNEVGPAQAGMVTAHFLATTQDAAWRKVLENVVVVLTPCHNPDGYATVVRWWRENKDDADRRGVGLPVLYHKYVGHDNNRDWFQLTQAESRETVEKCHMRWHPQIVIDQHQMGSGGARMFVPPFIEPYEPFVHPLLKEGLESLGRSVVKAMAKDGLSGVWCNRQFDAWTPARAFQHYHGGVRVLTEVASCRIADPIANSRPPRGDAGRKSDDNPSPWKGGRWGLDDIVRYSSRGALHAIQHGSDHRKRWLANFHRIQKDFCDGKLGPRAFLIANDGPNRSLVRSKLVDLLTLGGVEIHETDEAFVSNGKSYPKGSLLIRNGQPYFGFAAALLTDSPYPEIRTSPGGPIRRPYDSTCHYLPRLMGFDCVALASGRIPKASETVPPPAAWPPARIAAKPTTGAFLLDARELTAPMDVLRALRAGARVERLPAQTEGLPAGGFLVRGAKEVAMSHPIPPPGSEVAGAPLRPRRVGVYWSWTANMDEGWTRFFFDSMGLPFTVIRPADVRAGNLPDKVDVLVFASVNARTLIAGPRDRRLPERYQGGLGDAGQEALRVFVERGGTLVTLNSSSTLPIQLFDLPLRRVGMMSGGGPRGRRGGGSARISTPGSIILADVDRTDPVGFGCSEQLPVFLRNGDQRAFEFAGSAETPEELSFPVRYPKGKLEGSGFLEGIDAFKGKGAVARTRVGKGHVVMFAFSPQFRCQTWATYPLFLNALLVGSDEPGTN